MNNEPIDFVVTWVDGSDPEWQRQRQRYQANPMDNGDTPNRSRDWGLLRYWFRGVENFAPWVHRVYFVTCGQRPDWLNVNHPKLTLVNHRDYIPHEHLPTFNSTVIELYLHRIPGLSEQFVLFNDDMYLTAPTRPEEFFRDGLPCESALLDTITANDPGNLLPYLQVNNFGIINRRFQKREVLRKNAGKFFYVEIWQGAAAESAPGPLSALFLFPGPPSAQRLPEAHLSGGVGRGGGAAGGQRHGAVPQPDGLHPLADEGVADL